MSESTWPSDDSIKSIRETLSELPPPPWRFAPDPASPGTYYVSGPADTRIIAEGLSEQDAYNLSHLASLLPQATEQWEEVKNMWDQLEAGDSEGFERRALKVINDLQLKLAQYEGTTAIVPEVHTVGDLNSLHVGHTLVVGDARFPVSAVSTIGELVAVDSGNGVLLYLSPHTPAAIETRDPYSTVQRANEETVPSEGDTSEEVVVEEESTTPAPEETGGQELQ